MAAIGGRLRERVVRGREDPDAIMRLAGRRLATPVDRWQHAVTGQWLTLVLVNHSGTREYWHTLMERVGDLEERGRTVQWEGLVPAPAEQWAAAGPAERAAQKVIARLYRDLPAAVARRNGWVYQEDGLVIGPGWVHGDMTDLDAIRLAGPESFDALGRAVNEATAKLGRHAEEYLAAMQPAFLRAHARRHAAVMRAFARQAPQVSPVLIGLRSKLAVEAAAPDRPWVLIWGAGHHESIAVELEDAGWVRRGRRRWLTVGDLPPAWLTIWRVAVVTRKAAVDIFRAAQAAQAQGRPPREAVPGAHP